MKTSSYSHIYLNDAQIINKNDTIYMNSSFVPSPLSLETIPSSPPPQPLESPDSKASIEIDNAVDDSNTQMSLQQEPDNKGRDEVARQANLFDFKSSNSYFNFPSANNNLQDKKHKRASLQDPILLNSTSSIDYNGSPYFKLNQNMMPILPISLTYRQTIATTNTAGSTTTPHLSPPNKAINIEPSQFNHRSFYETESTQTSSSCPSVLSVTLRRPPNHTNDSSCSSSSQDQIQYFTQIVPNSQKQINDYYLR